MSSDRSECNDRCYGEPCVHQVSPRDEGMALFTQQGRQEKSLLEELGRAEQANMHARSCQVCDALEAMSEPARVGVRRALAGTIGERTLAEILTSNGYPTGRRAVARHRLEGHS